MNGNTNLFTHTILTFWSCTFDILFLKMPSIHFFNDGLTLLWNVSKDRLGFLDHLGICLEVLATQFMFQQWKQPKFGKPFSIERLFPFSIFLISHNIIWLNVVWLKNSFAYLHGDTLSGNTNYSHTLNSRVFFYHKWSRHLSSYTSMLLNVKHSFHSLVYFFLHFSFFRGLCATVSTKPAVTWDLCDIQMSMGACWKENDYGIYVLNWNSNRCHYRPIQREWASLLGHP